MGQVCLLYLVILLFPVQNCGMISDSDHSRADIVLRQSRVESQQHI